ncbi:DUF4034 domain-containing protein [Pseudonocardiaceae bacterium YIM PH 21723]|nr:DUF4034 domain-containing protein [Pseudonocardiaceae bacterium YIM PH 21723]
MVLTQIKGFFVWRREAKRRGMGLMEFMDSVSSKELAELLDPVDPVRWGLVPDDQVTLESPFRDQDLETATAAAHAGDWRPVADLLHRAGQDWDRRAGYVAVFGRIAAGDDAFLRDWRSARPQDPGAAMIYAESLVQLAWQIRGGRTAGETSDEQFEGFHRVIQQVEPAALAASQLAPHDPTPWFTLITAARGLGYEHDRFRALWQELIQRAPAHRRAHESALQYWCRKWYGSDEEMFAFAEAAASAHPQLHHLRLQAAVESQAEDKVIWRVAGRAQWLDTERELLAGPDGARPDAPVRRSYLAYCLMAAKRWPEALEQLRLIGPYAGGVWARFGDPVEAFLHHRKATCRNVRI